MERSLGGIIVMTKRLLCKSLKTVHIVGATIMGDNILVWTLELE